MHIMPGTLCSVTRCNVAEDHSLLFKLAGEIADGLFGGKSILVFHYDELKRGHIVERVIDGRYFLNSMCFRILLLDPLRKDLLQFHPACVALM